MLKWFADTLCNWYVDHKRTLPWREEKDPYKIWISEIILQQTRVQQGLRYYEAFLKTFPTLQVLAGAREEDVLRCWEGLGYYSRARNMYSAAKTLVEQYRGRFPKTASELQKIKGIGPYTAAAIASFAFEEAAPVLDGNVFRVLSRYIGIEQDITKTANRKYFLTPLHSLIQTQSPSTFNQAMMEFGAIQCMPKPKCSICPVRKNCYALLHQRTQSLPIKSPKSKPRSRYFHYLVLETPIGILFRRRMLKDIWKGLYDFVLHEANTPLSTQEVAQTWNIEHTFTYISPWMKHQLTHQTIFAKFFHFSLAEETAQDFAQQFALQFTPYEAISQLPKPILVVKYLKKEKILLF